MGTDTKDNASLQKQQGEVEKNSGENRTVPSKIDPHAQFDDGMGDEPVDKKKFRRSGW